MTQHAIQTQTVTTQLLHGRIANYRKTRSSQNFILTQADRNKMGGTAVAAGLLGLGGIAVGLSGMAMDTSEEADLVEFDLDGKSIKAWIWWSIFSNGDEVDVVAEKHGDVWIGYGIRRMADRVVALHPHCSRGENANYWMAVKYAAKITGWILAVTYSIAAIFLFFQNEGGWYGFLLSTVVVGITFFIIMMVISMNIARKLMPFVHLAEGIFRAFGWKNVKNIDLPAITKKTKRPDDPGALGVLYFRYPS